jgi:hypothetical protein
MVHHAIDVKHVEKNVCEALVSTLLDIPGKTKDTLNARMGLEEMKLRKDLHHKTLENGSKNFQQLATPKVNKKRGACAIDCMELKFLLVTQTMYLEW